MRPSHYIYHVALVPTSQEAVATITRSPLSANTIIPTFTLGGQSYWSTLFSQPSGDLVTQKAEAADQLARPKKRPPQLPAVGARVNQEALLDITIKRKNADKQRAYREGNKGAKQQLKENDKLKWGEIWGARKVCMGIHQYDIRELRRIIQLGTCPTARAEHSPQQQELLRIWLYLIYPLDGAFPYYGHLSATNSVSCIHCIEYLIKLALTEHVGKTSLHFYRWRCARWITCRNFLCKCWYLG